MCVPRSAVCCCCWSKLCIRSNPSSRPPPLIEWQTFTAFERTTRSLISSLNDRPIGAHSYKYTYTTTTSQQVYGAAKIPKVRYVHQGLHRQARSEQLNRDSVTTTAAVDRSLMMIGTFDSGNLYHTH